MQSYLWFKKWNRINLWLPKKWKKWVKQTFHTGIIQASGKQFSWVSDLLSGLDNLHHLHLHHRCQIKPVHKSLWRRARRVLESWVCHQRQESLSFSKCYRCPVTKGPFYLTSVPDFWKLFFGMYPPLFLLFSNQRKCSLVLQTHQINWQA